MDGAGPVLRKENAASGNQLIGSAFKARKHGGAYGRLDFDEVDHYHLAYHDFVCLSIWAVSTNTGA